MNKITYDVLSPDGIPIRMDGPFDSPEEREEYFLQWMKRYEHQGYYSSVNRRIPLDQLREHCHFFESEKEEIIDEDDIIYRMQKALDWSQADYNLHNMAVDTQMNRKEIEFVDNNLVCRIINVNKEPATDLVSVNPLELASELAHNAAKDEMMSDTSKGHGMINNESDMFVPTEDKEDMVYTEEASEVFRRHYAYFEEIIRKYKWNS